ADRVLNEHFGGTYMAYLALDAPETDWDATAFVTSVTARVRAKEDSLESDGLPELTVAFPEFETELATRAAAATAAGGSAATIEALEVFARERADSTEDDDEAESWDELLSVLSAERQSDQVFKDPEVLRWMSRLQASFTDSGKVGKSSSVADIVQTVHRELFLGEDEQYRIPETSAAVAQCLLTYQSSHRPDDLWHFVTPDYREASLWLQLTSGDNRDMVSVHEALDAFMAEDPPPGGLEPHWFGLTHINVVWQDKMVAGMLKSLGGAFVVVLLLMTVLFRSILWGLLAMVPLTLTIALVYGAVGIMGKPYDMPVAVLSSLALGLAIDFAIHFLARARREHERHGSWKAALPAMFDEPARAIARNAIVVAVGFLPLIFAPLVPYQTVGVLLAAILGISGVATLLILPALLATCERWFFRNKLTR
ncbi:MAG: putative RND superfamily exporter protein, partial [Planctomycetota bacterium]